MTETVDEALIRKILQQLVPGVDWQSVPAHASLEDAGLDSLDKANVFLHLEEVSGRKVDDAAYEQIDSIAAMVEAVNAA